MANVLSNNTSKLSIGGTIRASIDVLKDVVILSIDAIKTTIEIGRDLLGSTQKLFKKLSVELQGVVDDIGDVVKYLIKAIRNSVKYIEGLTSPITAITPEQAFTKGMKHIKSILAEEKKEEKEDEIKER